MQIESLINQFLILKLLAAIETFDFPTDNSDHVKIPDWVQKPQLSERESDTYGRPNFVNFRYYELPDLLLVMTNDFLITTEEKENLMNILYNGQREDWFLAFNVIYTIVKPYFIKTNEE